MTKKRLIAALLVLTLCLSLPGTAALAASKGQTVRINSADGLRKLAEDCTLVEYSEGLTVLLDADIDLTGEELLPIPSFSGVFDGQGHTIFGFAPTVGSDRGGLFRYLQNGAVVRDLHIAGDVTGGVNVSYVGALCGINRGEIIDCSFRGTVTGMERVGGLVGMNLGSITGCSSSGSISGKRYTGGIAGFNDGVVRSCENDAEINTGISEGGLELEALTVNNLTESALTSARDENVVSDTGGIAGYSTGVVESCVNRGRIGYPHYGYNVGGIVGRQSGYLNQCENHGSVFGRKDIAGIVGQMEPYLLLTESASLAEEINVLQEMINKAMVNYDINSSNMLMAMNSVRMSGEAAVRDANMKGAGDEIFQTGEVLEPDPVIIDPQGTAKKTEQKNTEEPLAYRVDTAEPAKLAPARILSGARMRLDVTGDDLLKAKENGGKELIDRTSDVMSDRFAGADAESLAEDYDRISGDLDNLGGVMAETSGIVSGDLKNLGTQMSKILLIMSKAMSGGNLDIFRDVSDNEPEDSVEGKVRSCRNYGSVEGDSDIGGIAGQMGIEYEFDLENKLTDAIADGTIISNTYLTKCVCIENVNDGRVTAKRNNAGGIVGQQQLGRLQDCEGYGSVASTESGYVGGVAGASVSTIESCYAMCSVSGEKYLGGIVGSGLVVRDCVSMVSLDAGQPFSGAISGWINMDDTMKQLGEEQKHETYYDPETDRNVVIPWDVEGNVYVGGTLGAIDGLSYRARAESISYDSLLRHGKLPEAFGKLKLRFMADGQLVGELYFNYGGSVNEADVPEVPVKDGFDGRWEDFSRQNLRFGGTVEAIYSSRIGALAVDNTRGDSPQPIVLAEGGFDKGAKLHLAEYKDDGPVVEGGRLLEKWVLRVDNNSAEGGYSIHYLAPEGVASKNVDVYAKTDGGWKKLDCSADGSYVLFKWDGDVLVFASVEVRRSNASLVIFLVLGAIAVAVAITLLIKRGKVIEAISIVEEPGDVTVDDKGEEAVPVDCPDETKNE